MESGRKKGSQKQSPAPVPATNWRCNWKNPPMHRGLPGFLTYSILLYPWPQTVLAFFSRFIKYLPQNRSPGWAADSSAIWFGPGIHRIVPSPARVESSMVRRGTRKCKKRLTVTQTTFLLSRGRKTLINSTSGNHCTLYAVVTSL